MGRKSRGAASLRKRFERTLKVARKRVRRSLRDPSRENVHEMRTAIRRLQAAYMLLPGRARKRGRVSGYMASVRELLKATNPVRDADVVRAHTMRHLRGETVPLLIASLEKERKRGVSRSAELGHEFLRQLQPLIRKSDMTDEEVRKRRQKLTLKLSRKVRSNLRTAVGRGTRAEVIHRLRMDSKMLRYVLQTAGRTGGTAGALRDLKSLQDRLGHIHDCDVTSLYLQQHDPGHRLDALAERVRLERVRLYLRFSRGMDSSYRPLRGLRSLRH